MHEIGIANSILEAVQTETRVRPGHRPTKVAVRIGELAAINPDALQFCFETLTRNTVLDSLCLEIELCPLRYTCSDCTFTFAALQCDFACPQCGSENTRLISGDQLELAYLELEEYGPSAA